MLHINADYTLYTGLRQRIQSLAWRVQHLTCKLIFFVSSAALAPSTLSNSEPPRNKRNVGTAEIEYFSDTSGKSSAGHFANLTAWNETPTKITNRNNCHAYSEKSDECFSSGEYYTHTEITLQFVGYVLACFLFIKKGNNVIPCWCHICTLCVHTNIFLNNESGFH